MISIKISATSNDVLVGIPKHMLKHQAALTSALREIGIFVTRETRRLLRSPPKTGIIYRIGGKDHQASAAGEAPANLTGTLSRSVGFKSSGPHEMTVGETAEYAKYLEYESRHMAPRPHMIKAVENTSRAAKNSIAMHIDKAING